MRQSRVLAALLLAGILAGPLIACTSTPTRESTGEYIDDSVISNKVRAKLIDDRDLNVTQIDVTTYKGVVQISGFVNSNEAKARATRVASTVEGVKQVANNLIVN